MVQEVRAMANGREAVYVKCPYYRREDRKGHQIRCEGILEGTEQYQRFNSLDAMLRHKNGYCKRAYRECPVAAALDRKYEYA